MVSKIFIGIAAVVALFLIYVALQPSDYVISREVEIRASPEEIFPFINDQRELDRWMPWAKLDPQIQMNFSGPESGVGSKASWTSSGDMGVGSSTIVESIPNEKTRFALEFQKPFEMTQTAEISIQPSDDASIVRWSAEGKNNFIGRLMCVFMNMDEVVGKNFEKGLSELKQLAEAN